MKTPYLKLEIYSTLNEAAVNKDKSTQRRQRMSDKATIPVVKTVVALKEIEKKVKETYQIKPGITLERFPSCHISRTRHRISFSQEPR